jgi:hypothetical protein
VKARPRSYYVGQVVRLMMLAARGNERGERESARQKAIDVVRNHGVTRAEIVAAEGGKTALRLYLVAYSKRSRRIAAEHLAIKRGGTDVH